ncbi:MAG: hypothetical protein KDA63_01530 [Planctomycetales bacterium]|nr:hypothetical protein [Planctomycetales bacterium]
MGRSYAGVLGPLAMVSVLVRGWLQSASTESTLLAGTGALFAFAAVGWVIGRVAQSIVDDSVRARIAAELAVKQAVTSFQDGAGTTS